MNISDFLSLVLNQLRLVSLVNSITFSFINIGLNQFNQHAGTGTLTLPPAEPLDIYTGQC